MTELQWLIKTLTEEKLSPKLKDSFIQRLGEVEANLSRSIQRPLLPVPSQAPSMQRLIEESDKTPGLVNPVIGPSAQRILAPKEVITSTGNGTSTRGPRKF